ncbi:MAG: ThuA domain-containing protein [Phaeodactylibacter sp.]|nr:ThuA domain-containing protein [Phaeodactylibacter sp.]
MKYTLTLAVLSLFGLLFIAFTPVEETSSRLNVLVFTKTTAYRHQNIPEGIKAFRSLADQENWNLTATEDPGFFNEAYLEKVDVVLFFNTSGDILNPAEEKAFEAYIRNGGGFVGIHAAADTEEDWPFYQELVGAYFDSHPPVQEARLLVRQATQHPAINHLHQDWTPTDEWYYFKAPLKSHATVLLELDESSVTGKAPTGQPHPIAWAHQKFGGRMLYTGIGHTAAQFSNPVYLEHLIRSVQWAGGQYEIAQPNTWQDLLDPELSQWDSYLGVPHESVTLPFDFPKQADVTKGKALGLNKDPLQVFSIETGAQGEPILHITGEIYGGLTSKVNYQNYHLRCQFKWGKQKWEPRLELQRDNGLLFHATGAHGAFWKVWMRALECQIQERDFGDFYPVAGTIANFTVRKHPENGGLMFDPAGVEVMASFLPGFNTGRVIKAQDYEKPNGEWNTVEILTVGDRAVFVVNGHVVSALTHARYQLGDQQIPLRGGKLQIQSEAAEAYYKNIQIRGIEVFPQEIMKAVGWE